LEKKYIFDGWRAFRECSSFIEDNLVDLVCWVIKRLLKLPGQKEENPKNLKSLRKVIQTSFKSKTSLD